MVALATAVACRHREKTPVERGQLVFLRSCARCHGMDARGTHPPDFTVPPRDLTDPELQARLSDAALRETVRYGKGQMPPFSKALVEEDLEDLILYVRSVARKAP